jgi:capsular exopolysaccharide synthesis family protein
MSRIQRILSRAEREGTVVSLPLPAARRGAAAPPRGARPSAPARDGTPPLPAALDGDLPLAPPRPVFGVKLHRLMVSAHEPFSPAAERYRSLRARIAQAEGDTPRRVLLVTSPSREDGRTVTVGNLAISMAQEFECRSVVVDADLRHARLHTLLGLAREPGLVDVVTGGARLDEALVSLPGHQLVVLPAGKVHTKPAELLGCAPMRRLMTLLGQRFDRVIVDAPPADVADTWALEPSADGLLLVVRAGRTRRAAIERALASLPPPKLLGLVLNDSRAPGATGMV